MNGAKKLLLVVSDGTKKLPNSYLKITDIRVNGKSINFTDVGFGAHYGDQYIQATDDYSIIMTTGWWKTTPHRGITRTGTAM